MGDHEHSADIPWFGYGMKNLPEGQDRWLLLLRHAQAGDAERFARNTGLPDAERPLSIKGQRRNLQSARGLTRVLPQIHHLWSSPYVRARQTAEPLESLYRCPLHTSPVLAPPWQITTLGDWLDSALGSGEIAILVGHEPDLSSLIGAWIGAQGTSVPMEKGTACLLRVTGSLAGSAHHELLWKIPQSVLRSL